MQNHKKTIILILSLAALIALTSFALSSFNSRPAPEPAANDNANTIENNIPPAISLREEEKSSDNKIISGNTILPGKKDFAPVKTILEINGVRHEVEITEPISVYGLLEKLRAQGKITFTERTYSGMGKLITGINGVESNGRQTWIYHVNGVEAKIGISNHIIKPGDVVSWEYDEVHY